MILSLKASAACLKSSWAPVIRSNLYAVNQSAEFGYSLHVSSGDISDPVASCDSRLCLFPPSAEDYLLSRRGPLQFRFMEMPPNRKLLRQDDRQQ